MYSCCNAGQSLTATKAHTRHTALPKLLKLTVRSAYLKEKKKRQIAPDIVIAIFANIAIVRFYIIVQP